MDATARFLAPKGEHSRIGELGPERGRAQGRLRPGDQSESEGKRPGHAANASQTQLSSRVVHPQAAPKTPKTKPQQQSNAKAQKPQQPKRSGAPVPQPPAPQKKQAVSSLKDRRREDRRPARPHGPVEAPHSGAQKDSTEQRSLMKPYYFNPDEE